MAFPIPYSKVENQVVEFVKVSEPLVKDEERIKHQADTIQEVYIHFDVLISICQYYYISILQIFHQLMF